MNLFPLPSPSPWPIQKKIAAGLTLLSLITLLSCGGGGGGTPSTPSNPFDGLSQMRIDVFSPTTGLPVDPTNLFPGESVRFRIVGRTTTGALAYVNVSGFTTNAPSSAGTLASDGQFQVLNPSSSFNVLYSGFSFNFTTTARVVSPQAVISGRVRTVANFGVSRVEILAQNSAGTVVARGFAATDGYVRFSVPTTAVKFSLDFATVDPDGSRYVRQFAYNGIDYSTIIAGCVAPLPPLTNGGTTQLASSVVVYQVLSSTPPPPPDGCNP